MLLNPRRSLISAALTLAGKEPLVRKRFRYGALLLSYISDSRRTSLPGAFPGETKFLQNYLLSQLTRGWRRYSFWVFGQQYVSSAGFPTPTSLASVARIFYFVPLDDPGGIS